jgi:hypothetical protein
MYWIITIVQLTSFPLRLALLDVTLYRTLGSCNIGFGFVLIFFRCVMKPLIDTIYSYVLVFFVFNDLRWKWVVPVIMDHHTLKLSFHIQILVFIRIRVIVMGFSTIFWQSVSLVEETVVLWENQRPIASHWQTIT